MQKYKRVWKWENNMGDKAVSFIFFLTLTIRHLKVSRTSLGVGSAP